MSSPTARSLALLRELGYTAKVVEHWNQYAKIRQDLFGLDILALKPGEPVLVVQATTGSNHVARCTDQVTVEGHSPESPANVFGWLFRGGNSKQMSSLQKERFTFFNELSRN